MFASGGCVERAATNNNGFAVVRVRTRSKKNILLVHLVQ